MAIAPTDRYAGISFSGWCLIAIGYAVAAISVVINLRYGLRMTIDEDGWIQGALMCALGISPAALASYSGATWQPQTRGRSAFAYFIGIGLVCVSVWNAWDFVGGQMLGKAQIAERKQAVDKDIAEITNTEILRSRRDAEEEMWRTYKVTKDPVERKRLEVRIEEMRKEPISLTAPLAVGDATNARSNWLSKRLGWDRDAIQGVTPIVVPLFMAIIEITFPWLGFMGRRVPPERGGKPSKSPANPRQFNKEEARNHLKALVAVGKGFGSNKEAAEAWGIDQQLAHKWLKSFRSEGIIRRAQRGRTKAVLPPHINGNGRALGNA
jgi:hypothetical protein